MSKPQFLMMIAIFLVVMTFMAGQVELTYTDGIADSIPGGASQSSGSLWSSIGTLWRLVTFSLEGVPNIVNFFLFVPIALPVAYMILEILKDLVPFT